MTYMLVKQVWLLILAFVMHRKNMLACWSNSYSKGKNKTQKHHDAGMFTYPCHPPWYTGGYFINISVTILCPKPPSQCFRGGPGLLATSKRHEHFECQFKLLNSCIAKDCQTMTSHNYGLAVWCQTMVLLVTIYSANIAFDVPATSMTSNNQPQFQCADCRKWHAVSEALTSYQRQLCGCFLK